MRRLFASKKDGWVGGRNWRFREDEKGVSTGQKSLDVTNDPPLFQNHPIRDYQKCGGLPSNLTPARQSRLNICLVPSSEMERSMPEVWNIFGGNRPPPQQHHYHPATANNRRHHHSHTSVVAQMHYPTAAATSRPMHYNWPRQSQEVLMCWSDRSAKPQMLANICFLLDLILSPLN